MWFEAFCAAIDSRAGDIVDGCLCGYGRQIVSCIQRIAGVEEMMCY